MKDLSPNVRTKLDDFIDALESEVGQIEGFEVRLDHPINPEEGKRQGYASIKEFVLIYLTRQTLDI